MTSIEFNTAFYIKLGRGGCWEDDSIANGRLRFGWEQQSLADINAGNWDRIAKQLQEEHEGHPGVATTDINRLRDIAQSTPEDVWVTFHHAKLWWTLMAPGSVEEDSTSKYRRTLKPWSDKSLNGRVLIVNDLPGRIAQLQSFRGTACKVQEVGLLRRIIEGTRSALALEIEAQRRVLCSHLERVISELHWKDFETLVDLVFRDAGWIRVSVLGQHARAYDLELREPITNDRYVVQVKSKATLADLNETISEFSAADYRRIFFVVHSPSADLAQSKNVPPHVDVVPPARLADLALTAGLSRWLEDKAW